MPARAKKATEAGRRREADRVQGTRARMDEPDAGDEASIRQRRFPPGILADSLTFQPAGSDGPTVVRDVSFRVSPGQSLLVVGPTGAGKSVLLRLIAGLAGHYPDPHAAGRLDVRFADNPEPQAEEGNETTPGANLGQDGETGAASGWSLPVPRPGRVVLVTQSPRDGLVGLDVFAALAMPLEQQGLPPGETRRRVEEALGRFGLGGLMWREVASLSSGEARRVALAGGLAQDAPLVLLDEPFADLDPSGARRLREDLEVLTGRRTVVVAEHRVDWVEDLADVTLHLLPQRSGPASMQPLGFPVAGPPEPRPALSAYDLSIDRGGRRVVQDAELDLGPGVWGLLGRNGAGKTSLLMALAGLSAPARGRVEVSGVPVWRDGRRVRPVNRNERLLRRRLQIVFQEPREAFFASSVVDELAAPLDALGGWAPRTAARRAREGLQETGRADLGDRSPQRLSGGEARLVQILGALLPAPGVVFLDEPTHGLDAVLRSALRGLLESLQQSGHLVVVATHEPHLLPSGAGWLFLDDSRLVVGAEAAPGAPGPAAAGFLERATDPSVQEREEGVRA